MRGQGPGNVQSPMHKSLPKRPQRVLGLFFVQKPVNPGSCPEGISPTTAEISEYQSILARK